MAPNQQGPSFAAKALYALGYLAASATMVMSMKIAFAMTTKRGNGEEQEFQKPWFNTFLMYTAMALALPFDKGARRLLCGGPATGGVESETDGSTSELPKAQLLVQPVAAEELVRGKRLLLVAAPASFGVLSYGLLYAGLLFIPASVWLLLRGAEVVFALILRVVLLKGESIGYQWIGVLLCFLGICLVGLASIKGEPYQNQAESSVHNDLGGVDLQALGIALTLGGLLSHTLQITLEEYILKEHHMSGLQIISLEGAWGACILTSLPVAFQFLPGEDHGHFEDGVGTVKMLSHNLPLVGVMLLFMFSVFAHEAAKIALIDAISAVRLSMFGAMRAGGVWAAGLIVRSVDPASPLGEAWTPFSPIEVGGFLLIVLGQVVYAALLRLPGRSYPESQHLPVGSEVIEMDEGFKSDSKASEEEGDEIEVELGPFTHLRLARRRQEIAPILSVGLFEWPR